MTGNRDEKLLCHIAMVAKFLDLNKPWPCKYGRKNENIDIFDFPVHDCTKKQNGSPCLFFHHLTMEVAITIKKYC